MFVNELEKCYLESLIGSYNRIADKIEGMEKNDVLLNSLRCADGLLKEIQAFQRTKRIPQYYLREYEFAKRISGAR